MISAKPQHLHERLIVALDLPTMEEAQTLVSALGEDVSFYKIGLEMFMSGQGFEMLTWLKKRNKRVFVDLKFYDVPQTVANAVRQLARYEVDLTTIHGDDHIIQAAVSEKGQMGLLAVTVLTSLDQGDIEGMGYQMSLQELVLKRVESAQQHGCDGIVTSGHEAPVVREQFGDDLVIVTPGVRPVALQDDQKRIITVAEAMERGVDYIVVGRPVRDHHGFQTPKQAAKAIQAQISQAFAG